MCRHLGLLEGLEAPYLVLLVDLVCLDLLDLASMVCSLVRLEQLVYLVYLDLLDHLDTSLLVLMGSLDHLVSLVLEPSFQVVCRLLYLLLQDFLE